MLKTVNLEEGMPLVDAAIRRATFELKSGRRMGLTAIKFIHGYGSSGNGGRKSCCRPAVSCQGTRI